MHRDANVFGFFLWPERCEVTDYLGRRFEQVPDDKMLSGRVNFLLDAQGLVMISKIAEMYALTPLSCLAWV